MESAQKREVAASKKALRLAWPNRHTRPMRASIVIRANVRFLRSVKKA